MTTSLRGGRLQAALLVAGLGLSCADNVAVSGQGRVVVTATRSSSNPRRYVYTVNNQTPYPIVTLRVGEHDDTEKNCRLHTEPLGWTDEAGVPAGSWTAPSGWTIDSYREEEQENYCFDLHSKGGSEIVPGSTLSFQFESSTRDDAYLSAPIVVRLKDGMTIHDHVR